jgi:hypothetical protein
MFDRFISSKVWAINRFLHPKGLERTLTGLTLIQLGEVKVNLANFDVKFRTKLFYVGFLKINLLLQKCLANLF